MILYNWELFLDWDFFIKVMEDVSMGMGLIIIINPELVFEVYPGFYNDNYYYNFGDFCPCKLTNLGGNPLLPDDDYWTDPKYWLAPGADHYLLTWDGATWCYLGIFSEAFLILALSLLVMFLAIVDYNNNHKLILTSYTGRLLIIIFILSLIIINNNSESFLIFDELFISSPYTDLLKSIVISTIIICIVMSFSYIKLENINKYEYFIILGFSTIGMITLITCNDLITLYIGIELQSLSFYILAAIKVYNNFSTEAGLKYFILGSFSSGILLFGCSLIYGSLGTTNFGDIKILFQHGHIFDVSLILGCLFLLVAILFKLGAAPFHMWLPDVYEGVPTIVTAIYSILPKIILVNLIVKLNIDYNLIQNYLTQEVITYCAIFSIIIGTLGALYQNKLKRLLAYSAINHVGFLLIGLLVYRTSGIFSIFFYLLVYMIISINIFTLLLVIRRRHNNIKIKNISEFVLLFRSNPSLAINFGIILFSIAGIPPLIGFYSKLYIFMGAIQSELYLIALVAAVFSVISSMYYIRLIKLMFFKELNYWDFFFDLTKTESYILAITLFLNLFFFCYPDLLVITLNKVIMIKYL